MTLEFRSDINLQIFDRFRHVGRLLRIGQIPDAGNINDSGGQAVHDAENCPIPPGLFKRDLVLPFLMFQEGGMKQKEIADEIRISPSTLSEMINRLVKDGYVERRDDPADRRAKKLILTCEGRKRAEKMMVQLSTILSCLFGNLEAGEKKELIRLLDKMLGNNYCPGGQEPNMEVHASDTESSVIQIKGDCL